MPLDASTPDVGMRGEPSLDAIAALDPDLVVTTTDLPDEVIDADREGVPGHRAARLGRRPTRSATCASTVEILGEATGTLGRGRRRARRLRRRGRRRQGRSSTTPARPVPRSPWPTAGSPTAPVSIRMYTPGSFLGGVADAARPEERVDRRGRPRLRPRADRRRGPDRAGRRPLPLRRQRHRRRRRLQGRPDRERDLGAAAVRRRGQHAPPARRHLDVRRPASAEAFIDATVRGRDAPLTVVRRRAERAA